MKGALGARLGSFLASAAVFVTAAFVFLLPPRSVGTADPAGPLPPPAASNFYRSASLGRDAAAADALWLRASQFMGAPARVSSGHASLGPWLLRLTDLAPDFRTAYLRGGILLATEAEQSEFATELLRRAEQQLPPRCRDSTCAETAAACAPCGTLGGCDWEISLWRGFVAYFGQLDGPSAAGYFCEAARRGGPVYLSGLAERLRGANQSCDSFRAMLTETMSDDALAASRDNLREADLWRLSNRCETESLRQAAGAFRLARGGNPKDLEELLREGFLRAPPVAPPEQCWELWGEKGPELRPCAPGSP